MPFVSQAQRGYMYANHPKLAKEFQSATPAGAKLPQHVGKPSPTPQHTSPMMGQMQALQRRLGKK